MQKFLPVARSCAMTIRLHLLTFLLLLCAMSWAAASPPAAPNETTIEKALQFRPNCPLSAGPVATAAQIKDDNLLGKMGNLIWARGFGNQDCTKVVVFAALYEGGSFLTRDIKSQVTEAVARHGSATSTQQETGATDGVLYPEIFDLGQNRKGYHFLVVHGPGGSETATALTSQDGRYDLVLFRFYIRANGEQPLQVAQSPALPTANSASIIRSLESVLLR